MKKIFTLLLSSLFSISLFAYDGSGLSISAFSTGMNFKVELDGRKVFMKDNSITLSNLAEGYHNVRIFREAKRKGYGAKDEIIYSTSVFLSRTYHTDIIIGRSGKVFVDSYRIGPENDWYNVDENGTFDDDINTHGGGWNNGFGNLMSAREFQSAKELIGQEWFETSRLTLAKTIIDKGSFTAQQVKELMYLFTFEKNRLEVAKYAYRKTADKQNFYQLNEALTFSGTKEELARFIRESR